MTESEWLACADPVRMLDFLRGRATDRKLRLFAVACCRRVSHMLEEEISRRALEVSEAFADGLATGEQRQKTFFEASSAASRARLSNSPGATSAANAASSAAAPEAAMGAGGAARVAKYAVDAAYSWAYHEAGTADRAAFEIGNQAMDAERVAQGDLIRDIFGPLPFRPVTVQPHVLAWNDQLVVRLGQSIYDERRWGDMPLLGDALLDAGCDNEDLLSHVRKQGAVHVRGCWLLDILLRNR